MEKLFTGMNAKYFVTQLSTCNLRAFQKTITDELEESPPVAGTKDDLMESMRRHYFGLLSVVEEEELEIPGQRARMRR